MDLTTFVSREAISALGWLGKRDWLEFWTSDFAQRTVWTKPNKLTVPPEDRSKYSKEHWAQVNEILDRSGKDIVDSLLIMALSKAIAGGPKVFQPTFEDCEALENTACTMSFDEYKQPYPVVIIEFPKEYKNKMVKSWGASRTPSHVIVHNEPGKFVNVHAFFDRKNVLSHITPCRKEYNSIEDAITRNSHNQEPGDFQIAELAQRLAVNFCMVMVLLGVRQTGPLSPEDFAHAQKLARNKDPKKAGLGKKLIDSTLYKVEFINQRIKLYEEEYIEPRTPHGRSEDESHRSSPKPHWRRGHYRQQRFGPQLLETKLIFIKPVLVRSSVFIGDLSQTKVTYKVTTKEQQ